LDLSNNKFSGRIPYNLERLQGFAVNESSRGYSRYGFQVEVYIKGIQYTLPYAISINIIFDLSNNNITGEIPVSIRNMSSLRLLNLSGNQLEGKIPAGISDISTLEQLDLAKNKLNGTIPQDISKLSMLSYLDVSSNSLCGPIPTGTQFYTFNQSSFQRNKCLCGFPLPQCNEKNKQNKTLVGATGKHGNIRKGWLSHVDEKVSLTALGIGVGVGFVAVVIMFITWDKARYWVVGLHSKNIRRPFYGLYRFPT